MTKMAENKKTKVGWGIGIEPEVSTELAGTKIGAYFQDPDVGAQTEIKCAERLHELFGIGKPKLDSIGVPCVYSSYVTASIFGTKIIYPEDDMPQIIERGLKDIKDAGKMKIPDLKNVPIIIEQLEKYEYLKKRYEPMGFKVRKPGFGGAGPLSTAISLRGGEFFGEMVLEPDAVKDLMEIITETTLRLTRFTEQLRGEKITEVFLDDDFGGLVSPELHEEFILPYMKRIYEAHDAKKRLIHTETYSRKHLRLIKELGITYYDAWPYRHSLCIKDILEELPGVNFAWNFETPDLLHGTPEAIKEKYRRMAAEGAQSIRIDCCARRIKLENIKAFIEIAKEFE